MDRNTQDLPNCRNCKYAEPMQDDGWLCGSDKFDVKRLTCFEPRKTKKTKTIDDDLNGTIDNNDVPQ